MIAPKCGLPGKDTPSREELAELAQRAKSYDEDALSRLFDLFFERLRRYFYYRTGDLEGAEELAAETLVLGIERIQGFEDRGGTIGAWLFGIARNLLAREREASPRMETVEIGEVEGPEPQVGTEDLVLEKLTHEELYRAMGSLPEDQRDVVLLRFIEGLDAKTVGKIIGKRPGAVRALQFRALKALRRILESRGDEH